MKHKHYEIIVAKAANMDLVVFFNPSPGYCADKWEEATTTLFPAFHPDTEYFLCLPRHKESCLHWLNGGESQYLSNGMDKWINFGDSTRWSDTNLFMTTECELRIKPKKEKRVVVYDEAANKFEETAFKNIDEAKEEIGYSDAQFIEIEVEV